MDPGSEAPRLGLIEMLGRICGDYFLSGKLAVQERKLTLDFSRAWLILKVLHINICRYIFCDVLYFYRRLTVFVYTNAVDNLKQAKLHGRS